MKKRQDIIRTATRLFAEQGFDGTTTLQIAREANVTEPLIYYHFEGKDDLFIHIIGEAFQDYHDQLAALPTETASPFDQIQQLVDLHFRFIAEKPDEIFLGFSPCPAKLKDPDRVFAKNIDKKNKWLISYLKKCLQNGIDEKVFHEVPIAETAQLILALIHGIIRQRGLKADAYKHLNAASIDFCRRSLVK